MLHVWAGETATEDETMDTTDMKACALADLNAVLLNTRKARLHDRDADCTLGADDCCVECGVSHGDPCTECGSRGFHESDCRESDDYDPTPWCSGCNARTQAQCHCGPLAANE